MGRDTELSNEFGPWHTVRMRDGSWATLATAENHAVQLERFCQDQRPRLWRRRRPASAGFAAPEQGSYGQTHGKTERLIAIVDNDEGICRTLSSLLRSHGYAVATFPTAEQYLRSEVVDETECLILDVNMPGMSGLDLQSQLIADGHTMPIIFVTALSDDEMRARAAENGASGWLIKPFRQEALIDLIERALSVLPDPRRAAI